MKLTSALFSPSSKNKKNPLRENFLYSGKMKHSISNIKKFLIFSQKKAVIIFQEIETPKRFFIFFIRKLFFCFKKWKPRTYFFYISEKETFLYFKKWKR